MGLLDHLWDDTVAGPTPDSGLGKLRKHNTFSFRSSSSKESEAANERPYGGDAPREAMKKVTRSITIVKPPGYQSGSPPASPAGSATPGSPFSGSVQAQGSNAWAVGSLVDEIVSEIWIANSSSFGDAFSDSSSRGSGLGNRIP